jgi:hypothetical protein
MSAPRTCMAMQQRELPYLQLVHPVLTLGLLVRARFGFCSASPEALLAGSGGRGIVPIIETDAMRPTCALLGVDVWTCGCMWLAEAALG